MPRNYTDDFRSSLRAAVRGFWMGALSRSEFNTAWSDALDRYLSLAWDAGAARYGISPEDYTQDDLNTRDEFIGKQQDAGLQFAVDIATQKKDKDGKLEPLLSRVELWVPRYDEMASISRMNFANDAPLRWNINRAKENCRTCLPLDGWVKRASYWQQFYEETGIRPKSEALACHGFRCGCQLLPTSAPISRGKPPVRL